MQREMTLCQPGADETAYHYYRVTLQPSHLTELCLHVMKEGTFFPLLLILPFGTAGWMEPVPAIVMRKGGIQPGQVTEQLQD